MPSRPSPTVRPHPARRRLTEAVLILLVMTGLTLPTQAVAEAAPIEVQFLSLTDLHGYLSDVENQTLPGPDGLIPIGGAGHLKAHIDRLASTADHSYLIGSGDQFSGWPDYTQAFANEPTVEVLNALGMDFDVAGNHEFDRELTFLQRMVDGSCFGIIGFDSCFPDSGGADFSGTNHRYHAANVIDRATGDQVLPSSWETSVPNPLGGRIRIGVIGIAFPGTHEESLSITTELEFQPLVAAANRVAQEMQADGIETIVVAMHEGGQHSGSFNDCVDPTGPIVEAAATLSPAVDAILGGHWHTAFACSLPGPDGVDRPVIEAGNHGRIIGEVRLRVDPRTGDVFPGRSTATNHPVTRDITPDREVQQIVEIWESRWAELQQQPLGRIDRALDFATDGESRMGNLAADLYYDGARPRRNGGAELALVPPDIGPDVVGSGLDAGDITFGDAWGVMGISPIVTVGLTGAQIDQILEQQWLPPAYGCRRQATLAVSRNVKVKADLARPIGDRIGPGDILLNHRRLDPDRTYRVATTSVLILHAAQYGYPTFAQGTDLVRAPRTGQDVWLHHLRRNHGTEVPDLGRTTVIPGTPPPYDGPFGPLTLLSQDEITATATSQGSSAYSAAAALDGKCSSMWHSAWSPPAPLPQSITLDLGTVREVSALLVTPRQDADVPNGRITRWQVQVSQDGEDFRTVATGTWDTTVTAKIARFPEETKARWVRLVGLEGGSGYAAAAELNIAIP